MDTNRGPERVERESSAIAAVGHDPAWRTLFVRFRAGGTNAYLDVSPQTAAAFLAAPSPGRVFKEETDPAFRYVRLD